MTRKPSKRWVEMVEKEFTKACNSRKRPLYWPEIHGLAATLLSRQHNASWGR